MRDNGAIVESAVDIAKLTHLWEQLDAREQRTLGEIRLAKGRLLVEARHGFPLHGPYARGWGELLAKWKIAEQTARDYMKFAGYVEVSTKFVATDEPRKLPTYAEAGIVRARDLKPRPLDFSPPRHEAVEVIDAVEDDLSDIASISNGIQRHARSLFNLAQRLAGAQANKTGVLVSPQALSGLKSEVLSARAQLNDFCRLMGWAK